MLKRKVLIVEEDGFWIISLWDKWGLLICWQYGLGVPVENASTVIRVENGGKYRVWVRTRDWVKQWDQTASPGRFELLLNGKALEVTFGTERAEWHYSRMVERFV